MIALFISVILYGLIPLAGILDIDKITMLLIGLLTTIPLLLFWFDYKFFKKNYKDIIISGLLRSIASVCYFFAYDLGYMNIVVSLVFLMPVFYASFDSIKNKAYKNLDLVFISSIGIYFLTSKYPNFEFGFPFLISIASPFFSALSLYYYKNHIQITNIKETISVVYIRNIITIALILIFFSFNLNLNPIDYFYSILYGIVILGIAMVAFFHASKEVDSKLFAIITNFELIISFFIMVWISNKEITSLQYIGLFSSVISIWFLKRRMSNKPKSRKNKNYPKNLQKT